MLRFAKTRLWVASAYYIIAFNLTYVNPKYFPFQKVICKKKNPKKQKKQFHSIKTLYPYPKEDKFFMKIEDMEWQSSLTTCLLLFITWYNFSIHK